MPRALPTEMVDAIIGFLSKDRPALLLCSQLCTVWRNRALHHLLDPVQLGMESRVVSLAILLHANPAMIQHIRDVHIHTGDLPLHFLPPLVQVKSLSLRFGIKHALRQLQVCTYAVVFPNINTLALRNSVLQSPATSLKLMLAFPRLGSVCLDNVQYLSSEVKMGDTLIPEFRLRALAVIGDQSGIVLWLRDRGAMRTVTHLMYDPGHGAYRTDFEDTIADDENHIAALLRGTPELDRLSLAAPDTARMGKPMSRRVHPVILINLSHSSPTPRQLQCLFAPDS